MLYAVADDVFVFFIRERSGFAGGAADDDGIGALIDLEVNQFGKFCIVDASIRMHRRDDCDAGAFKNEFLLHCKKPPIKMN